MMASNASLLNRLLSRAHHWQDFSDTFWWTALCTKYRKHAPEACIQDLQRELGKVSNSRRGGVQTAPFTFYFADEFRSKWDEVYLSSVGVCSCWIYNSVILKLEWLIIYKSGRNDAKAEDVVFVVEKNPQNHQNRGVEVVVFEAFRLNRKVLSHQILVDHPSFCSRNSLPISRIVILWPISFPSSKVANGLKKAGWPFTSPFSGTDLYTPTLSQKN